MRNKGNSVSNRTDFPICRNNPLGAQGHDRFCGMHPARRVVKKLLLRNRNGFSPLNSVRGENYSLQAMNCNGLFPTRY